MEIKFIENILNCIKNNIPLSVIVGLGIAEFFSFLYRVIKIIILDIKKKSFLSGFWLCYFKSEGTKDKKNIEIFHFRQTGIISKTKEKIEFKYQHFDNKNSRYLKGVGSGYFENNKYFGAYCGLAKPGVGSIILCIDQSLKSDYNPRLLGKYIVIHNNHNQKISIGNNYNFIKIKIPILIKIKFKFNCRCFKNFQTIKNFYDTIYSNFKQMRIK